MREGSAINDFVRPDRVVIGCESDKAKKILSELYRPLYLLETPILFTRRETAELIKYAANAFLATKITFINEISDLCEKVGANVSDVSTGMGLDGRIGKNFYIQVLWIWRFMFSKRYTCPSKNCKGLQIRIKSCSGSCKIK